MADSSGNGEDGLAGGPEGDEPMSFFDHLAELRKRLFRATGGLVVGLIISWVFVDILRGWLTQPLADAWTKSGQEGVPSLQTLSMLEGLLTDLRIALVAGIFVAGPIVFWQVWLFIAPGLYSKEKKYVIPFVATSVAMFTGGAAFCYFVVLPVATEYFLTYMMDTNASGGVAITPNYTYIDYFKYATRLLLGFGAMFELPLAVFFLAKAGVVTHRTLLRYWKLAIMIIMFASAFLTPPDPITLTLMALPMTALFFVSVLVAYVVSKPALEEMDRLERELAEEDDDDDDDESGEHASGEHESGEHESGEHESEDED